MVSLFDPVYLQAIVYAFLNVALFTFYLLWVIPVIALLIILFFGLIVYDPDRTEPK